MSTFSFSRLNKYLLTVLPHLLKDLQGDHFNYVKIAQHALVYFNQGNTSKLLPNRLMHSVKKQQAIYHLKRIKHNPKRPLPLKETVVFDSGRTFSNEKNQPISVYFHEFLKHDKRNQITHLIVPSGNKNAPHEIHLADFPHLASFPLDKKEAQILKEVKNVLIKLRENK
ncbi:MAG: hypothetical protein ACPGWM_05870, partial [Flavobacteriales bacterium]